MKEELEKKLFENYPGIFKQKDLPATHTAMCWGIACGDGWYDIIDTLCSNIKHYARQQNLKDDAGEFVVEALQVKEKFGGLRFYICGGDTYTDGLISMAESMSCKICEECGCPGKGNKNGWIKTLCLPCREKMAEVREKRFKEAMKKNEH